MKKFLFTLISLCFVFGAIYAQGEDNQVSQPTCVVGRVINNAGEVTEELTADFTYLEDGKLLNFNFPDYSIYANYYYGGDYLTKESITKHWGIEGDHVHTTVNLYTYENGLVTTNTQLSDEDYNRYYVYNYLEDGRLERKDGKDDNIEDDAPFVLHWSYDYEDGGKTVIETYYTTYSIQGEVVRKKTTSQYDDSYNVIAKQIENYNVSGELTSTTLTHYYYTEGGLLAENTTQTLNEGAWVNTSITRLVRDTEDRIVEELFGVWDDSTGEWNFNRKIDFETSEDGKTYRVSFYKKSGGSWTWDVFHNETILFGNIFKLQQRLLRQFFFNGECVVNQFEFTMETMERPIYLDTEEKTESFVSVYPNPGHGQLCVKAPVERAFIRFYDTQGKLIMSCPFDFSTFVNTESWRSGMYLWEIWKDDRKEASGKWIKR